MNISDLKDIDLKNIDLHGVLDSLRTRKEVFLRVVFIVGGIFGAFFAYSNRQSEEVRLHQQIPLLEEKTQAIDNFKKSELEKKNFLEDFPDTLGEDELKDFAIELADKHHLKIKSISSVDTTSDNYFQRLNLQMSFTTEDFTELVLFIHEIESSGYAMRVDSWKGQLQGQQDQTVRMGNGLQETKSKAIDSQIKITATKIKK